MTSPTDVCEDRELSWLMAPVRRVAARLAKQGKVAIPRKGVPVADPDGFKGVYRIGVPREER